MKINRRISSNIELFEQKINYFVRSISILFMLYLYNSHESKKHIYFKKPMKI